jgi:hypothetical protein
VSLVPTFNNWPRPGEIVPAEETLAAMVSMSPRDDPADDAVTIPVFLLDSWRLAYRFEDPGEGTYDNRYILTPGDLPDAATLRQRGIQRVLYVVEDLGESSVEEDDLHVTFLRWQRAGVALAMVDLTWLERPVGARGWFHVFDEGALTVRPRATVVDAPGFYDRARGGFGGLVARPTSVHIGGIWFEGPSRGPDPGQGGACAWSDDGGSWSSDGWGWGAGGG